MKPLSELDTQEARGLRGVLFDLDDTVLSHGVLTRAAYDALWALKDGGLHAVAVTGRPSGWGEVLVRQWPIDGCVTENGAVVVVRDEQGVTVQDSCSRAERQERRGLLAALVERVRVRVPAAHLTDDVAARRSDVTWDVGERQRLRDEDVALVVREIEEAGARWSLSSVHLHATFDGDDKASGAVRFCVRTFGEEEGAVPARFAFVGDSGNDAACFAAFHSTFGVANVRLALRRLSLPPRYVAARSMGEGFAEIAGALLSRR